MNPSNMDHASLTELVTSAFGDVRQLVDIEVELAKDELRTEARSAMRAAIAFGVAASALTVAVALFAVAIVLALGGHAVAVACVAGGFLVVGAAAGALGYSAIPKNPLEKTRARVQSDVQQLKENMA